MFSIKKQFSCAMNTNNLSFAFFVGTNKLKLPPNPQGITALQQLNILEGYNLTQMGK